LGALALRTEVELRIGRPRLLPAGERAKNPQRPNPALLLRPARLLQAQAGADAGRADASQPHAAYVDQLIAPLAPEEERAEEAERIEEPQGRRFIGADLGAQARRRDGGGTTREQGARLRYRQETRSAGDWYVEADARSVQFAPGDPLASGDPGGGGQFTLYQSAFPLTSTLRMDNALGTLRGATHPFLSNSYRIFLPGSLFRGGSVSIGDGSTEFRAQAGALGRTIGNLAQRFVETPGTLSGGGIVHRAGERWTAGAQLWRLDGHPTIADHSSGALALQYFAPEHRLRLKGQALRDSFGRLGLWVDTDQRSGQWLHRFGAFRMQPRLLWTDAPVLNDQQGLYYRADRQSSLLTLSAGAELVRDNIHDDPLRPATRTVLGFGTANWRIDRLTSAGGTLSLREARTVGGLLGTPPAETVSASVFGSRRFDFGTSRLQLSVSDTRSTQSPARTTGLLWDHDVVVAESLQIGGQLGVESDRGTGTSAERFRYGLTARTPLPGGGGFAGSLSRIRATGGTAAGEDSLSAAASLDWPLARELSLLLQFGHQRNDPPASSLQAGLRDTMLLVQLRFAAASGVPFAAEGVRGPGLGVGTVRGRIFFDENQDGVWQATEKPASGVPVYLDGRFLRISDSRGEFEFPTVPTGDHTLLVAAENLPLPWAPAEAGAQRFAVPVRGTATVDIPLRRMDR
jgi:hypothetical protein